MKAYHLLWLKMDMLVIIYIIQKASMPKNKSTLKLTSWVFGKWNIILPGKINAEKNKPFIMVMWFVKKISIY